MMQNFSLLKLFLHLLCNFYTGLHVCAENKSHHRVLGAIPALPHEFPFAMMNTIPCESVLIRPGWVMTAGHCLSHATPPFGIYGGKIHTNYGEPTEVARTVVKIFIHPDFAQWMSLNDIGLMKLNASFELSEYIKPVTLVSKGYNEIECAWATSFRDHCPPPCYGNDGISKVDLPIRENSVCEEYYTPQFNGTTMICAGGYAEGGKDTCAGDSGGPLLVLKDGKYVQVGITSWGEAPCGKPGYPGGYTRVATFLDWIDETIRKEEEENGAP